jgi:hypothetical protein
MKGLLNLTLKNSCLVVLAVLSPVLLSGCDMVAVLTAPVFLMGNPAMSETTLTNVVLPLTDTATMAYPIRLAIRGDNRLRQDKDSLAEEDYNKVLQIITVKGHHFEMEGMEDIPERYLDDQIAHDTFCGLSELKFRDWAHFVLNVKQPTEADLQKLSRFDVEIEDLKAKREALPVSNDCVWQSKASYDLASQMKNHLKK